LFMGHATTTDGVGDYSRIDIASLKAPVSGLDRQTRRSRRLIKSFELHEPPLVL
jgi:hypothetical protein